ncbi:MAG TPA: AAA family ATPase [Mycobacteriales bacterium]|nr:AAA family ATPase [Mycobacteriales bacterium]
MHPGAATLTLTAALNRSPVDHGLAVVRLHRSTVAALGLVPWAPVRLQGRRASGAAVAFAPDGTPAGTALCDEVLLRNLGLVDGAPVQLEPVPPVEAATVTVAGGRDVVALVDPELLREALLGKWVTDGDDVTLHLQGAAPGGPTDPVAARSRLRNLLGPAMTTHLLRVTGTHPAGPALVTMGTVVGWDGGRSTTGSATPVLPEQSPRGTGAATQRTLADLPGLEQQGRQLQEWLDLAFHHPDLLRRLGTTPGTGVLLTGPAGSGKAALVEVVTALVGARLQKVWAPSIAALEPNAAAKQLTDLLGGAARTAPAVVLLEDVEALAPRDGAGPLLPVLLLAIRDVVADGRVAVVCSTARPERVDPQLREPGTLDRELAVPVPDRSQRLRLLEVATRGVPLADDVLLDDVAARTPGFVAADLLALVREASLRAAARHRVGGEDDASVARTDLDAALEVVHPTAMGGAQLDLGRLTLDDVGDMAETKAALTEAVLWPLQYPDTFARLGVSPPRGVLLYGPPGCGKTFLVRALAGTGQANVLSVKGAELLSKWVGESERAVRELFRRAREAAPSLVFLDEVDALAPTRGQSTDGGTTDRVVAALLTELDGVEALRDVSVVGATNRPDLVDPAMLRPGRLERLVYVPPPDAQARAAILRASAKDVPLADDVDLVALGARTEGYSAADCAALVREAALTAMRESLEASTVTAAHLEAALDVVRPSLDPGQVAALAAYAAEKNRTG